MGNSQQTTAGTVDVAHRAKQKRRLRSLAPCQAEVVSAVRTADLTPRRGRFDSADYFMEMAAAQKRRQPRPKSPSNVAARVARRDVGCDKRTSKRRRCHRTLRVEALEAKIEKQPQPRPLSAKLPTTTAPPSLPCRSLKPGLPAHLGAATTPAAGESKGSCGDGGGELTISWSDTTFAVRGLDLGTGGSATVGDVMERVWDAKGVPPECQRLSFGKLDITFENWDKRLGDFGIDGDSNTQLRLHVELRGGHGGGGGFPCCLLMLLCLPCLVCGGGRRHHHHHHHGPHPRVHMYPGVYYYGHGGHYHPRGGYGPRFHHGGRGGYRRGCR